MGNAPLLMRSRPGLPSLSTQVGKHLGINGDHIAGDRVRRAEGQRSARAARLRPDLQGQPHHHDDLRLLGRPVRPPVRRHALHAPGDLPLDARAHPLRRRRATRPGEPSWWGLQKKQALSHLQQPHRDAGDGRGHQRRRIPRPAAERRRRPPERRPARGRAVQLQALRPDDRGARGRELRRCRRSSSAPASGAS